TGPQERKRKREKEETRDNWEAQVIYLVVSSMILHPRHGFRHKRNGAKGTTDALYRAREEERIRARSARDIQAKSENEEKEKQGGKTKRASEDGVNCRRQGHRLYLAGTADTCLRRYTRTVF
ncbi:hypothetical protein ALC57_09919, partial [Trachymyrmex cornetzi]